MKPKTTLFGLILVLGMAVVIGGVWKLVRQTSVQRQVLPDGTVVVLKGVTFGRQHRLVTGTLWQRLAGRLLPSDLVRRFGIPVLTYVTTNDSLMVWWEQTTQSGVRTANFAVPVVAIADDQGNEFTAANVAFRPTLNPSSQGGIFELVPRGNERIAVRMRFTDPYARTDFGVKFEVKNPAPKFRSRWVATSLPVTARVDDLEAVLTDLSATMRPTGPNGANEPWMAASVRFAFAGRPSDDWQVCGMEVFDEMGGSYRPNIAYLWDDPRVRRIEFRGSLSARTVWKVRLAVCKVSGFESNEVSTFRNIPLEGLARATFAPRSNIVNGVTLTLFDVTTGRPRCLNLITIPPDDEVTVVLSEAIDDQGQRQDVRFIGPRISRSGRSHGYASFPMDRNLKSKSVDATFGISRLRYVEMLVRPSNSPAKSSSAFPPPAK